MPRAALTSDEITEFRARAVRAATRLFAHRGYDAVTMRALATELACSPMTPYRYFDGKDTLFAHVRADAFRRFADRQAVAFESATDPTARLAALGRAYVQFAVDEPDAYRIMFELSQAPAGSHPELDAQSGRAFSYLLRAVELRGDADPLTAAHLLWAGVHGIVSLYLAGKLALGRTLEELVAAAFTQWSPA